MNKLKAPLGKLPPFSVFVDGENMWTVSPEQEIEGVVKVSSLNLPSLPQVDYFDTQKEVEVIRLARPDKPK